MNSIALFIMSEKGLTVLNAVIQSRSKGLISHVIIGRDKNVLKDYAEEIKQLCLENSLPWSYRGQEPVIKASYVFAVSWRWLLPIMDNLIIFHDSPLPKYRGFAPLVNQLIQGEREIGVSALFACGEYDKGKVIAIEKTAISYPIRIQEAIAKSLHLYTILSRTILGYIQNNENIPCFEQDETLATYSLWRDEQDYFIDWSQDADWIERFVDATGFPYLQSQAKLNGEDVVIYKVKALPDIFIHNRDIGKIIFVREDKPVVVCGRGLIQIQEAAWKENNISIIPLKHFRSRFS